MSMPLPGLLLLALLVCLPVGWVVAEFRGGRALRIGLGLLAIGLVGMSVWGLSNLLARFQYNAWYGAATDDLIGTSLEQIEDGHLERVLKIWRGLQLQYHPTYETRAHYDELVEEATSRMRGDVPIAAGSAWDAPVFTAETWGGHWEDDTGYWIVIDAFEAPFRVVRSGQPRIEAHDVSLSADHRVLRFTEGDRWRHTLVLQNKYEADCEWFDLEKGVVWKTRPMFKLVRASAEMKARSAVHPVPGGESGP
ncbi:MAG: hypothetical protein H7A46_00095 [Verrucomicrobiales bacterium]|nr:hypothetical protein [Verrucomicrobiales bacterium]